METIGVVILHYKNIEKTIDCVDSFLKLKSPDFKQKIALVCNSGNDESDKAIRGKYKDDPQIKVIITDKPLVFSRAMNVGVKYLQQFSPKFVILSNNDITFEDSKMYEKIDEEYRRSKFGVMGPDVHTVSSDTHSSPFYIRYYLSWLENLKIVILLQRSILLKEWKKEPEEEFIYNNKKYKQRAEDVMLQGSFVILSRDYLQRFPKGIYPQKSFFLEEDILLYLCRKFKLKTVYSPNITVDHIHSVAINQRFQDKEKKRKFQMKQTLSSRKTLLKIITGYNIFRRVKYSKKLKRDDR